MLIWRPASVGGGKVKLRSGAIVGLAGVPEPRFTMVPSRPPIGEGHGEGGAGGAGDVVGDGAGEMSGDADATGLGPELGLELGLGLAAAPQSPAAPVAPALSRGRRVW